MSLASAPPAHCAGSGHRASQGTHTGNFDEMDIEFSEAGSGSVSSAYQEGRGDVKGSGTNRALPAQVPGTGAKAAASGGKSYKSYSMAETLADVHWLIINQYPKLRFSL